MVNQAVSTFGRDTVIARRRDDTKFHQMMRGPSIGSPPSVMKLPRSRARGMITVSMASQASVMNRGPKRQEQALGDLTTA